MSLDNDIALVTGASRGIGAAIVQRLAMDGATVIGTATGDAGAQSISARLAAQGVNGIGLRLDVTDPQSVAAALSRVEAEFGAISVLVNNAGITRDALTMRMKDDDWQTVIDTDLTAVFRLSRACLQPMIKARKGRIISIASVVGAVGNGGQANYAAAKAGIVGFSKSLAREVGARGITVNVVAPGFIDTDMTQALPEHQRQALLAQIPQARFGSPMDVANAVAFLASNQAAYVTGESLHINGGMHMA